MCANVKEAIYKFIDSKNELLRNIGISLWNNPEIGLEEHFAHDLLTDTFEKEGFQVTKNFILQTGFKAEFKSSEKPEIVYFCEYDALPSLGHACGHNLIAEASVGAALGLKHAMEHYNIKCKLVVFGSPGEENAGGKILMMNQNILKTADVAMMVHPREMNSLHMPHCALKDLLITFKGQKAHSTASPWEGRNALDAASLAYQGVALYTKQMKSACHININIKMNSEDHLGIVPSKVMMESDIRAPSVEEMKVLQVRLNKIMKGAALMTECEVDIEEYEEVYFNLVSNKPLLKTYKLNADQFHLNFKNVTQIGGSTDMGNVSQLIPSIHPVYFIGSKEGPHTNEFVKWTGLEEAHKLTIIQAKILAATGVDVATDSSLIESAKIDFMKSANKKFTDIEYQELYN